MKSFSLNLTSSKFLLTKSGTSTYFLSHSWYFFSLAPLGFFIFKALIDSFKIFLAIGADTVPPYWITPFGLSIATYTTTLGSLAGKNPIKETI